MDLNDYPQQRVLPWKPIVLAAGGVLLLIVVVVVVIRLVQNGKQEAFLRDTVGTQATQQMLDACEGVEDEEGCRATELTDFARASASAEICEMIEAQDARDNCYWGLARDQGEETFCDQISEAASVSQCRDGLAQARAFEEKDVSLCEGIVDELRRSRCVKTLGEPVSASTCASDEDPTLCGDLALLESAQEELDRDYCDQIANESRRGSCLEFVQTTISEQGDSAPVDSDSDGLTDEEEATYGTDPFNPDTDGDGYTDGDEVAAGYDPNGPGTLE